MSFFWLLMQIPIPVLLFGILCLFLFLVFLICLIVFVPGADQKIILVLNASSSFAKQIRNKANFSSYTNRVEMIQDAGKQEDK